MPEHRGKLYFVKTIRQAARASRQEPTLSTEVALWNAIVKYADDWNLTINQVVDLIVEANNERNRRNASIPRY